jgi:hypothetical protein
MPRAGFEPAIPATKRPLGSAHLIVLWFKEPSRSMIANRVPAGTEVPAKDFLGAREDFFRIL